ncbi:CLUMA_CG018154, isoform A [Clunio marinus]|uniref:Angiotensin-converting enzyme n=1 Tax=Clunio marinus TaxID=568069 RepID=A0A1J1J340_9DIPT|nr:CLUMA_CG018154, isoform A [Clunio marinus]
MTLSSIKAQTTQDDMINILAEYDKNTSALCNQNTKANWDVQTDVLNEALVEKQNAIILEYSNVRKEWFDRYFKDANIDSYTDPDVKRKLKILKDIGTAALSDADLTNLNSARNRMSTAYNSARICPFGKPNCDTSSEGLTLDPDIELLLSSSENFDEMKWTWEQWHEKSGKLMRDDYKIYIEMMNKAAIANGHDNAGEMWRERYEDDQLIEKVDKLWDEVKPLYNELHTYVRNQLRHLYGDKIDKKNELIPAHLLGNMWAQNWVHLYDRIKPFKNASLVDVTRTMEEKNFNVRKMFEMSDDFYMSMGLPSSAMSYSDKAVIEKPEQTIACHASAWDFCDGEDFRIKMCTKINMEDFVVVHHEMGHIMYFLLYKDQPLIYKTGANPGFHEAVGDTIALSVSTPQHLETVGLLENYADSEGDNINALFHMALQRVAFLPFGLLIDKWRWDVFSGDVPESQWNKHWWDLRERYQMVQAPSTRGEEFFDPGAKYHIPADSQYIAYFVAHILEFSFYRSLCIEAKQYDPLNPSVKPLHKCDFYQNKEAGKKLQDGLSLGFSKHWSEALQELTGESDMSASALMEYFAPLQDFLKKQNDMSQILEDYDEKIQVQCNELVKAHWEVATDSENTTKQEAVSEAVVAYANFTLDFFESSFKGVNPDDYTDEVVKRQLKYATQVGRSILPTDDLENLTRISNGMMTTYNTAKICPHNQADCDLATEGLTLDPEITFVMSNSTDYDELLWVWTEWRNASGKKMRSEYKKYVELVNKAAVLNGKNDNGEMWRESYEDENFTDNVDKMWSEVEPLYNELHTYVKRKLEKIYDKEMDKDSDLIPAHLLGNMWAQSWVNIYERVKPFASGSLIDVTENLQTKFNVLQMFEESNRFYMDLGLENNDMSYNETLGAVIEKPTDRVITCHASAWDFCDGNDFRIKMCTSINQEDFVTVHHEMGHIQYYILYKDQPSILRTGANPGFHEAVGDLIALSVSTPGHLKKIGLLDDYKDSEEDNINALFKMALERVAFLPFGLLIDKWRWDVFKGDVAESDWNKHWWDLREKYQKVKAPNERSEDDFDPGAKFHIPDDTQYIAYFIAHILQFQMHRALCITAGQYDPNDPAKPLHKCDIDGSKEAGEKIREGLKLGLSKHWSVALEAMTGEKEISGEAVMEYFKPLYDFLKSENEITEDKPSQLIPIVVGSVIGAVVIIGALVYGIVRYQRNKQSKVL